MQKDEDEPRTLLVFPPFVPQMYLFPYLSLPILAGYLERRGYPVRQRDWNIEFFHHAVASRKLDAIAAAYESQLIAKDRLGDYDFQDPETESLLSRYCEAQFVSGRFATLRQTDPQHASRVGSVLSQFDTRFGRVPRTDEWDHLDAIALEEHPYNEFFDAVAAPGFEAHRYSVVGISIAMGQQLLPTVWLSRLISSASPSSHIVLGGPVINLLSDHALQAIGRLPFVHSLVRFGGAQTLLELVTALEETGRPPDVCNILDCTSDPVRYPSSYEIPDPKEALDCVFDKECAAQYPNGYLMLPVLVALGCYWGKCAFCSYVNLSNREHKRQHVSAVVDQIETLARTHNVREFRLITESLPPTLGRKMAEEILRRGLDISMSAFMRIDPQFTPELLELLHKAGLSQVEIGIESLNQRVLDAMGKGYTRELILSQISACEAVGIEVQISFIFDFPSTTLEEAIQDASDLYGLTDELPDIAVQTFGLLFGTTMHGNPAAFGIEIIDDIERSASLGHDAGVLGTVPYLETSGMSRAEKLEVLDAHRAYSAETRSKKFRRLLLDFNPRTLTRSANWKKLVRMVASHSGLFRVPRPGDRHAEPTPDPGWLLYNLASKKVMTIDDRRADYFNSIVNCESPGFEDFVAQQAAMRNLPPHVVEQELTALVHDFLIPDPLPLRQREPGPYS